MKQFIYSILVMCATVSAGASEELPRVADVRLTIGGGCGAPPVDGVCHTPIRSMLSFVPAFGGSCYEFSATIEKSILTIHQKGLENCTRPVVREPEVTLELDKNLVRGKIQLANPLHIYLRVAP